MGSLKDAHATKVEVAEEALNGYIRNSQKKKSFGRIGNANDVAECLLVEKSGLSMCGVSKRPATREKKQGSTNA